MKGAYENLNPALLLDFVLQFLGKQVRPEMHVYDNVGIS